MKALNVLLYDGFTTMDALGPAERCYLGREKASENATR